MKQQQKHTSEATKKKSTSVNYAFRKAEEPQAIETVSQGRVKWGKDNLYPQMLVGLAEDNPIHGGILNQKIRFITAGGLTCSDALTFANIGGQYDLNELADMLIKDGEYFNGYAILFKRRKVIKEGLNEWYAEPIDFELIRATENGIYYEYSEDWSVGNPTANQNYKKFKSIHYLSQEDNECLFVNINPPKQRVVKNGNRSSLTRNTYPVPKYKSAIVSILAGNEMDFFTYAESVNGMKGGTLIYLGTGSSGDDEKDKAQAQAIKDGASNRDTQGGSIIVQGEGSDQRVRVEQMNGNDLDKRYIEQNKEIAKKIMIAQGVISPALFGVLTETMFGSQEEMTIAYELFVDNYTKPAQRFVTNPLEWAFKLLNKKEVTIQYNTWMPSFIKTQEATEEVTVTEEKMSKQVTDLEVISMFEKCGVSKSECFEVHSQEFCDMSDEEFMGSYDSFAVSDESRLIISMIRDGESYQAVLKAIGKDAQYLRKALVNLGKSGYLDNWTVTDEGKKLAVKNSELKVLYSYELRPNAPALVKGGKSREFCEKLISLDRLYSRSEIDTISGAIGRDVWYYRGGWYHNPNTDKNTPSCRHIWKQKIVGTL